MEDDEQLEDIRKVLVCLHFKDKSTKCINIILKERKERSKVLFGLPGTHVRHFFASSCFWMETQMETFVFISGSRKDMREGSFGTAQFKAVLRSP